jgi:UDP-glucose 4-epimerase
VGLLSAISLRYFNAAGAAPDGSLRERHSPETHLIPLVLDEATRVLSGGDPERTTLSVFGDDYETKDGTCVRDYVHVSDVCEAHLLAAERLLSSRGGPFEAFNLGSETGSSVLEVIAKARAVTGADVRYRTEPRRPGDPPVLVASAALARATLGWQPKRSELDTMMRDAWRARAANRSC